MLHPIFIHEGLRMFRRNIRVRLFGLKKYSGTPEDICRKIIEGCWDKKKQYYKTSTGHFCEFWSRDFGMCVESIIKMGHKGRAIKTYEYALRQFKKHNKITTTISPRGFPVDFPSYAPDSLAFLIRSLAKLKAIGLVEEYKDFLNSEIEKFYLTVIDEPTGLVRKDCHFSSIKDYSLRCSSCYDNSMAGMLELNLHELKLNNPLKKYNYKKLLLEHFWKGEYFIDDLSGNKTITGDANVFPFWCGVVEDHEMLNKSIKTIQKLGLDSPFPLRYYHEKIIEHDMHSVEFFAKGYERDTLWLHMGLCYLDNIAEVDKKWLKKYLQQYSKTIEKYKTFIEVFNEDGTPFTSPFYYADEGMIWCSKYLDLSSI